MNKLILLTAFVAFTGGCAKSSDVESINKRVTVLEEKVSVMETDMSGLKSTVADAATKAAAAEAAANRAADAAQELNNKLNSILKQTQ